ncbi:COX15/CtaA family protein [Dongia sp.]|uniref:COX15/CtaA family protein n=1 Tax=Dongia sp. TaxID=1977262 RepID=UPI0035AD8C92
MTTILTQSRSQSATAPARPLAAAGRAIGLWLVMLCVMVMVMVMLGGVTRLTDSGLSIMEWKPIMGTLPPLSDAAWEEVFALYRQIAEYKHVNAGMTLDAFKEIFWWEYFHRLWGRLLAVAFAGPLLWFWFKGYLGRRDLPRLFGLFALGALQGVAGWFMVASGFQDRIDVSQYRLVIHLMLALAIFGLMLWYALDYLDTAPLRGNRDETVALARHARWMNIVIAFEIALGGLVAGTDAGFIYNDFPRMNGHWLSPDLFLLSPWWTNFTENVATIQFQHRLFSGFVAIAVISFLVRLRRRDIDPVLKRRAIALPCALAAQAFLGITTLMLVVPISLAVLHQLGAFVLLGAGLALQHGLQRRLTGAA